MVKTKRLTAKFVVLFLFALSVQAEEVHDAARKGDLAKIKGLLEGSPALLEARSENEKTPLHFAAQGGHREIVELLLEKGADVNVKNIASETPLHYAAAMSHKEIVELLITEGAVLNSGTSNGSTPLHYAANLA